MSDVLAEAIEEAKKRFLSNFKEIHTQILFKNIPPSSNDGSSSFPKNLSNAVQCDYLNSFAALIKLITFYGRVVQKSEGSGVSFGKNFGMRMQKFQRIWS